MAWEHHTAARAVAARIFPDHAPEVLYNGRQYVLSPTPFGRIELLRIEEGFLVAADRPAGGGRLTAAELPQQLRRHLRRTGLRPWTVVPTCDATQAIAALEQLATTEGWKHRLLLPLNRRPGLLGEERRRLCAQVSGLLQARGDQAPLVQIVGPDGVGKRSVVAAAARHAGLSLAGQLPLGRILVPRALVTGSELLLETLLEAGSALRPNQLLVVTDADLLPRCGARLCRQMIAELQRLAGAVLLARAPLDAPAVISLDCPGLEPGDARQLIADAFPELSFAGRAFHLLRRAATLGQWGILPARLLYLVRLATALLNGRHSSRSEAMVLAPDEVAGPIQLVQSAWADNTTDGG